MNQEPSAAETLLVTEVTARIERALADQWHLQGNGLFEQINNLRAFKVGPQVIWGLHYLRVERNGVVHHPRRPLRDAAKFRQVACEVLPVVERRPALAASVQSVGEQLRSIGASRLQTFAQTPPAVQPASQRVAQLVQAAMNRLRASQAQSARAGRLVQGPARHNGR